MAKLNELDRIFITNYFVGGVLMVISILGMIVSLTWDSFAHSLTLNYEKGIGLEQIIGFVIFFLLTVGAGKFIQITNEYQKHYGE